MNSMHKLIQRSLCLKHIDFSCPAIQKSRNLHSTPSTFAASPSDAQLWQTATLIPGDGVGPELCNVVQEVFKAAEVPLKFEEHFISELHPETSASAETVIESVQRNKLCLKGILASTEHRSDGEAETLNMTLRKGLNLFANVVHVKSMEGLITARHKTVDMIVIREQTEGEYSALEHECSPGIVEALKITTREKSLQIAKFAFNYAIKNGRKKVTAVHKANIMKLGDGLFLDCCGAVAEMYPEIEFNNMIIDNCAMQMVSKPHQFDVLVLPNLYGNVIDNLAAGLVGGAGMVPGASFSQDCVVFEPGARHTFSGAQGKNVANPTAMLLAGANMLEHNNLHTHADIIKNAVRKVIRAGKVRTKDIGGHCTTQDFCQAVIKNL